MSAAMPVRMEVDQEDGSGRGQSAAQSHQSLSQGMNPSQAQGQSQFQGQGQGMGMGTGMGMSSSSQFGGAGGFGGNTSDQLAALRHKLTTERARNLVDKDWRNPITVSIQDTLANAFSVLCNNDILAAPVVTQGGEYLGFVTMLDLVNYATILADECGWQEEMSENFWENSRRFRTSLVSAVCRRPRRRETHRSASVFHVLENMCAFGNQHYMAMLDPNDRAEGVITQSMLVKFIFEQCKALKTGMDIPVWKVRPFVSVITTQEHERAVDAFRLLAEYQVTGIGIVDQRGELTGVLSTRDLRGIRPGTGSFRRLFDSVKVFKDAVKYERISTPWKPVCVERTASLGEVLEKMVNERLHRVFIVSAKDKAPVDVISQTDILRFFCQQLRED